MTSDVPARTPEILAEILAEVLDVDAETITAELSLAGDLGVDSLAMIEIVIGVEQGFGVAMDAATADAVRTVADLTAYVEQQLA